MTQSCLNTHILYLRGLFVDLYNTYLTKLNIGRKCEQAELNLLISQEYLKYFCSYQPFGGTITYAYSFTITRIGEDTVTVSITISSQTVTYTGTGDLNEMLNYFKSQFEANNTFNFEVYINEDILYIYSYDTGLNFNSTTTVSTSDEDQATIEDTNMQNSYCEILDFFNCLTYKELCNLICHSKKLLSDCNCN